MRDLPTACCPSIKSCRRSCGWRAEVKGNCMQSQASVSEIDSENYRFLQQHIYSQVGIVLEDDKHYLFESRLAPIVKQLGLKSTNELCMLLNARGNNELGHRVAEAMTTNETYFFREPSQY